MLGISVPLSGWGCSITWLNIHVAFVLFFTAVTVLALPSDSVRINVMGKNRYGPGVYTSLHLKGTSGRLIRDTAITLVEKLAQSVRQ